MAGSEIIVCGTRYDVGNSVVTFEDEKGYSAYVPHRTDNVGEIYAYDPAPGLQKRVSRYRPRRSMGRSNKLKHLRQVVRQVVVHLDGCRDARMCFHVLHNQRGLSVHFMVDTDGTIYQTLDLLHCSFHAGGVNEISVGIELQNRGDAARYPNYYKEGRETVTCRVHGAQFLAYDYTKAQYVAMTHLSRTLAKVFDIPLASPHEGGDPVWTLIPGVRNYRGFLGHYHICRQKWDPGPFDFHRIFRDIGARTTFPLTPPKKDSDDTQALSRAASRYFDNSEQDVNVHFPVGPLGKSRLWHGGVHLGGSGGSPVHAVQQGQIVVAKMGPPCPIGSCNFVLIRHRFATGKRIWTFFSLYYHLAWATETADAEAAIPWLQRSTGQRWRLGLDRGEVTCLEVNVESGELIGNMGEAGPTGNRDDQIHFAIFSKDEIAREIDPDHWEVVDGSSGGRFCKNPDLLKKIDRPTGGKPRDGLLSRRELRNFFQLHPKRSELHRLVVRHKSEWTPGGWQSELDTAPDFASLPPARRRRMIAQQVTPTLWMTADVIKHADLPADGVVYSYHPIEFLPWFEKMNGKHTGARGVGIGAADQWEGKMAPSHLTVDAEAADAMTDEEDFHSGEQSKKLTLEDLASGYPDET